MWQILKPVVGPLIDKLVDRIPDPNARAEAREQFETQLLTAVTEASTLQAKINQVEAAHSSVFVAGWRPFIGWVCGLSLLWAFLLQPIMVWGVKVAGVDVDIPIIETGALYQLVLAMLGMGGLRTFEKMKGVARETSPL
ncbi:3TM-type holin [Bowmanella sp. JS7-9]|uniref:3TM-type holin n=1 Tax=Pseudobowmanella zhangzhouensis TaxID=1537679 RepID=A0ABW1XLT5_9ALTE|nr:3TM-type holin [Bowmanella sp. JS7-9]TBX20321.1 hypothetical protein TK45_15620 [Bowmanella sp. JS7-9]